jgi:hypothetical protein
LDAKDGESIGVDPGLFVELKRSLEETNRKIKEGELDANRVHYAPHDRRGRHCALLREHQRLPSLRALKPHCTKGAKPIVTHNLFEAEREQVRALKGTEAFVRSALERRKFEMTFAHLKRNLVLPPDGYVGLPAPQMSSC